MTTLEILEQILRDIGKMVGVEAAAIGSRDGLVICSTIPNTFHAETFAAMSATMTAAAETAVNELGKNIPERIIVESKNGRIIAAGAGPKALLLVMMQPDAGLGLVLLEMKKASESIKRALG
jgi:predicted regulator of Ras-like GTPase activity (Roadblock/LC7/MglB family)